MIELEHDKLNFSFPELHPEAKLSISFQRTLRIPDDGRRYPLPPGLGNFPLRHIDDYANRVPDSWLERAGVIMPMYQREALWIYFSQPYSHERCSSYPFAVKIYTGKINAVTGKEFKNGLSSYKQDYLVVPGQPWLDGYCVEEGTIRQFVAMPLGQGYTAEEQLTGEAEWGGIQILVYPMDPDEYEARFPKRARNEAFSDWGAPLVGAPAPGGTAQKSLNKMGIAPGGRMKQEIYKDIFGPDSFDQAHRSRCFLHILNSQDWQRVTGEAAPSSPVSAQSYKNAGLPWFDYYDENRQSLPGSKILDSLKSISTPPRKRILPEKAENERIRVIKLGPKSVREGDFWDESI
ncbi:MAG: hypothetical protein K2X27_14405 [Candidatus Obscuribacterales bacterium]|nr:hypothetical protein [Candidatus Obscuribacterales bacterium]